jgi:hypothetical protein
LRERRSLALLKNCDGQSEIERLVRVEFQLLLILREILGKPPAIGSSPGFAIVTELLNKFDSI